MSAGSSETTYLHHQERVHLGQHEARCSSAVPIKNQDHKIYGNPKGEPTDVLVIKKTLLELENEGM